MGKTLAELNEKAWYRLLKVLYVFLYLPSIIFFLFAYGAGKDYHPVEYPNSPLIALNDPEFYKLSNYDKIEALSAIDNDFKALSYSERNRFIEDISKIDIKKKEIKRGIKSTNHEGRKGFWDGEQFIPPEEVEGHTTEFIVLPRKTPLIQTKNTGKYVYASYHTQNLVRTITNILIVILCYVLIMEIIRRIFYYVVIGKVFPRE